MNRCGQSLIDILIGIALGALLIAGGASLIVPALRTNQTVNQTQTQAALGKELADNVKAWAAGNWSGVLALSTGSARYYLATATSSFAATGGTSSTAEQVAMGSSTYVRYFSIGDVYRDANGAITSTIVGNFFDPSTKLVTIAVGAPSTTLSTYSEYVTRSASNVFNQADWSGGAGQTTPVTVVSSTFASSSNINYGVAGIITLSSLASGTCQL